MRCRTLVAAFAALLATPVVASSQNHARPAPHQAPAVTVVYGTVLGSDGAPLKLAHVHLLDMQSGKTIARAQAEPDGRFALATTRAGAFRLEFTGVDHYSTTVPLLAPKPASIAVDVRLKHYAYTNALDSVTAMGDWNRFSFSNRTPLVRQADGRYAATVTVDSAADSVAYELMGLEASGNRSINGTASDRYAYDEGGDYRSVITAHGGHAEIALDPAKLDRTSDTAATRVTFRDAAGEQGRIAALWQEWQTQNDHWQDSAIAASKRHDHGVHYDWAPFLASRTAMLPKMRDPVLHQLIEQQILDATIKGGKLDSLVARRILGDLPTTSPWWAFGEFGSPSRMMTAWAAAHPRPVSDSTRRGLDTAAARFTLAYIERAVAENPDSGVKAAALAQGVMIAQALHDMPKANGFYDQLVTGYPDAPDLSFLKSMFAPNRLWRVGADVPAFHVRALDDTSVTYTPASFAGKIVLVDFWATWCGPCVGEMKYLQAAHDSLAGRGLEMLSISLDNAVDDVRKFRAGDWKMPWLHAFAGPQLGAGQMRQLEINFIPRAALIGRDGKILAVDDELRGDSLLPTLRKALEAAPTP